MNMIAIITKKHENIEIDIRNCPGKIANHFQLSILQGDTKHFGFSH